MLKRFIVKYIPSAYIKNRGKQRVPKLRPPELAKKVDILFKFLYLAKNRLEVVEAMKLIKVPPSVLNKFISITNNASNVENLGTTHESFTHKTNTTAALVQLRGGISVEKRHLRQARDRRYGLVYPIYENYIRVRYLRLLIPTLS
jgi:hypothetical protein